MITKLLKCQKKHSQFINKVIILNNKKRNLSICVPIKKKTNKNKKLLISGLNGV